MPQPTHQYDWPPSSDWIFHHFCQLFEHWLFWVSLITQVSVVARCCSWSSSSSTACCAQKLSAWRENKITEKTTSWSGKWFSAKVTLPKTNSSPLKTMFSNRNLLFQGSIFRCELLVSGRVFLYYQFFSGWQKSLPVFPSTISQRRTPQVWGSYLPSPMGKIPPISSIYQEANQKRAFFRGMLPSWSLTSPLKIGRAPTIILRGRAVSFGEGKL